MSKILILSRKDVESIITMRDTIEVMKTAFAELTEGSAVLPQRISIFAEEQKGLSLYMPAFLPKIESLAVKVVTVFKENPTKFKLPTTLGKVLLQDIQTGDVICIMDGGYLTAMRTGAVSGCAIEYLARKDSKRASLFGAGAQGETQLIAACEARPNMEHCKVFDLRHHVAKAFAAKMSTKLNIAVEVAKSPEKAVRGSDIVLTATTSPDPLFKDEWLEAGVHISGVGSSTPETREIGTETVKRAKIVCDQVSACLAEAGDLIIPINQGVIKEDHIYAELGEIVNGKKAGRQNDSEITFFKSVGLAIQDAAAAKLVYDKARERDKGIEVEI